MSDERDSRWRLVARLAVVALAAAGTMAVGSARGRSLGSSAGATPARAGAGSLCAIAKRQGSVPAHDTCVNALAVDVTGDGRADLVFLYDRTHTAGNGSVSFGPYTLKVIAAGGGVLESRIQSNLPPSVIVAAGRVNDEPGVELFIQVARISSGSGVAIYSDQGGRLVRSNVTLTYGGDSATRFGFSCMRAPRPAIVQRSYELLGPGIGGRWREKIDTYTWNGPRLRRGSSVSTIHHGWPGAGDVGVGAGCGRLPGVA